MANTSQSINRPSLEAPSSSKGIRKGLRANVRLITELTRFELILNLTRSRFGWSWWFIDPLVMIGVFGIFKRIVLGADRYQPYFLFIGCALLSWKFFSTALARSAMLLRAREPLIKAFPFPTWVLPCTLVLEQLVFFIAGILTLIAVALAIGQPLGIELIQVIPLIGFTTILTLGSVLLCSTMGVFAIDLSQYINHFIRIVWFLSPGMYGTDLIVQRFGEGSWPHRIFLLNPLALVFEGFRSVLYSPQWIPLSHWLTLSVVSLLTLLVGGSVYRHYNRRLIKHF
ncbi:ABC transporter permease [Synechococcus sp. PCC 7336]|uniref:ABC transporter permease n=1 Tax=Synechococcus sp. PCC 7336 TaxID=195250 RepID=UPI000345A9DF|nr:ABC transporter permease [Synechococcus sp. PCC 7336]